MHWDDYVWALDVAVLLSVGKLHRSQRALTRTGRSLAHLSPLSAIADVIEKRIEGTTFKRRTQEEEDDYIQTSIKMEQKWVETSQEKFKSTEDEKNNILKVLDELVKVSVRT